MTLLPRHPLDPHERRPGTRAPEPRAVEPRHRPPRRAGLLLAWLAVAPAALSQSDTNAFYLPFDDVPLLSSGAAQVVLNGSAVIDVPMVEITADQDPDDGHLLGVQASVSLEGAVTLEVSAAAQGAFSETVPVATLPLPTFMVGNDILVTPVAIVSVKVSGAATSELRTSFVLPFAAHATVAVGPGFAAAASDDGVPAAVGVPEVAPGSSALIVLSTSVAVVFQLSFHGIPIGGPMAGVSLAAKTRVKPFDDPWWSSDGRVTAFSGYWGIGIPPVTTPGPKLHLGDADGPLGPQPPRTRWSVALDGGVDETARGLMPDATGLRLAARSDFADEVITHLAPDGALISSQLSTYSQNGLGQAVVCSEPTLDGGCMLSGNGYGGVRVDRLGADDVMLWSRVFRPDDSILPGADDAVAMPDGGFAFLGRGVLSSTGVGAPFIGRLDVDGNLLWARNLVMAPTFPYTLGRQIAPTADGGLLLTGSCAYTEVHGSELALNSNNLLLARFDADGALVFCKVLGNAGGEDGRAVAEADDGSIWVCGGLAEGGSSWGWVARFTSSGGLLWSITLHGEDPGIPSNAVVSLAPVPGGVVVLGERGLGAGHDAWLAQLSERGTPRWWKTIAGPGDDAPLGLASVRDGVLGWGSTRSLQALGTGVGSDGWVLRTSVDGMLHFDPANEFDATNEHVGWRPPAAALSYALDLAPVAEPTTFTVVDMPLPFAPSAVTETVLSE